MTYKLINNATKEETICSLVTIDGFEYYVSDNKIKKGDTIIMGNTALKYGWNWGFTKIEDDKHAETENEMAELTKSTSVKNPSLMFKKVIATNNPNIDIPKVVNEVDFNTLSEARQMWQKGYNKAKETYQYTEEDLISFAAFCSDNHTLDDSDKSNICWQPIFKDGQKQTTQELLSIWKEQQIKTIYYE